ncbi:MAG TPA: protein kinase, partial [Nitrolancea sp.]|nr:protein kinase [Nitrolancea sp.]
MFDNQEIERFIGRSFGGYRVTRFIASGRTGAVFAGVEEASPDNAVAIKVLDPNLTDETFDERFEQTALGVAGLSHPNIVQVREFGSDGALHFIVTDLIEGESLRDWLVAAHKMGSSLTAETITSIAQQVGGALFFAHRSGYVHGDIKPENILVT